MRSVFRVLPMMIVVALLVVSSAVADVADSNGNDVTNTTLTGKVTAVTTEGGTATTSVTFESGGSEYTIDGDGGDSSYFDELEKAMDNDNTVTLEIGSDGSITKLTRAVSPSPDQQGDPDQHPQGQR